MTVTTPDGALAPQIGDSNPSAENKFSDAPARVRHNDPRPQQGGKPQQRHGGQPKRERRDVHGWVCLDKPVGMTSTHAVAVLKRLFNAKRAGHAGTLDPLASGGLPIALGEATKTVPFVMDGRKRYRFTVQWGEERDTDDTEGRPTHTSDARPGREAIEALLPRFTGLIEQVPPQYSAIKVQGERAYDLARDGEAVELAARPVEIHELIVVEQQGIDCTVFEAECGKGTYVRSLARDMGRLLGCYGHVIALRRTQVGPFDEAIAVAMDDLKAASDANDPEQLLRFLQPVEAALADLPELLVSQSDAASLARGQTVLIRGRDAPILSGPAYATSKGRLIALGELAKGALHPTRVFNLG